MRLLALAVAVLLARAPAPEVCGALNVTVSPGPVVDYLEGENATLLCHVSQKRRKDSLLAVRWFFARPDSQEALMVKMTKLRIVQYYGNFSRSAYRQRLRLLEERRGALYTLSVLTLQPTDQGHYVCKVQEISKHRNKWTAWSNGSSGTEMRGNGDAVKGTELSCEQAFLTSCLSSNGFPGDSVVKNLPAKQETQEMQVRSLGWEDSLKEEMATHSSILA